MTMPVRMHFVPGDEVKVYEREPGDTYEKALLSFGINPDTVLIFHQGQSIPQDSEVKEEMVEVVIT